LVPHPQRRKYSKIFRKISDPDKLLRSQTSNFVVFVLASGTLDEFQFELLPRLGTADTE
jgi:Rad3-related DNA helicase